MKLLVIGGVAAGMSAASKFRRLNKEAEIIVYERGAFTTYGACGLPYYISNENDDHQKMIARSKEQFDEVGIQVKLRHEVVKVDPAKKQLMVRDLETSQVFLESYDRLMISVGTAPIVPDFPGIELERIHLLKTMQNGLKIKGIIEKPEVQNVTIVGGGYIGIEMAEALTTQGKEVRIIEMEDRILRPFDRELTEKAEKELIDHGVSLHLDERLERFEGDSLGNVRSVMTNRGSYETDFVLLSLGVRPATSFLKGTGIQLAKNGAIVVDREMRTNVEDIFAAGDCAEVYHKVKEENDYIPLGTNANKCGRLAGANIAGSHEKYVGTLGSAAIKIFNLEMGRTGLSEQEAKALAIDYTTVFVESMDHPGYYPNATQLWIKLICEKRSRRLLGAQVVGEKGAVLRVDAFAVAIHAKMTADQFGMVDFCYAPPFAGVWDAMHIASNAVK
ncbi:CoA-disulfide reductase [Salipaludibacillus daqingensis]|uniref:CoA-disulfide reductase n=1 Tax=Salipaludibacillus daqingensis TaxID=3041001 RepID=UPI002475E653|nr:CoA-disulfide reductase [Salipaludibacillus daqingensis]